jgi:hypothetical protein
MMTALMCQSLTYDQRKKRARDADSTPATGVREHFCNPHSLYHRVT